MELVKIKLDSNEKNFFIKIISLLTGIDYHKVEEDYLYHVECNKLSKAQDKRVIKSFLETYHTDEIKIGKKIKLKDLKLDSGKYIIFCKDKVDFDHAIYLSDGKVYARYKNLLDINVSKVYKRNELRLYKTWMDNYSFFSNNTFVLDELNNLIKLEMYTEKKFEVRIKKEEILFKKMPKSKSLKLVKKYFKRHKISINIKELIKNKSFVLLEKEKQLINSNFKETVLDGKNYFDDKEQRVKSVVYITNTLEDAYIMVHELTHHRNHPNGKRNIVSNLLTESLSYTHGLIFGSELKYDDEKQMIYDYFITNLFNEAYSLYYIYKILEVYKKKKSLEKEAYDQVYKHNDYNKAIKDLNAFVKDGLSIFRLSYHLLGKCMAVYMFVRYKEDESFYKKIEQLNNSINTQELDRCLSIIDLKDFTDLTKKYNESIDKFLDITKLN